MSFKLCHAVILQIILEFSTSCILQYASSIPENKMIYPNMMIKMKVKCFMILPICTCMYTLDDVTECTIRLITQLLSSRGKQKAVEFKVYIYCMHVYIAFY